MKLRPYQEEANEAIARELSEVDSTVAVMATGTGKTILFSAVCEDYYHRELRCLVLAHRKELIEQAAEKIHRMTGIPVAIEQGDRKEGRHGEAIVVGSVQSMIRRLDKFDQNHFGLIVTDECHRAVAVQHAGVADHFMAGGAKHLGVTATPNRSDKLGLKQRYESVAYEYEILNAINDGWLVPIEQYTVDTDINFSEIRTQAGDLNQKDLNEVMMDPRAIYQICGPIAEMAKDRPTLTFAVSVAHAKAVAAGLADMVKEEVAVLDGKSHPDDRRRVVEAFRAGEIRHLVNCLIFSEGFDSPPTALIAMARPTKSGTLYKQCIGRGTRPLDGIVDPFAECEAQVRRNAIANSAKPNVLILDFAGNSGRHNLCSSGDILDGLATPPELAIAKAMLDANEVDDVLEAFRAAKARIRQMELEQMRSQARKNFKTMKVDPFLALDVDRSTDPYGRSMTDAQRKILERKGVPTSGVDYAQALSLIQTLDSRYRRDTCTYKQAQLLVKYGLSPKKIMGLGFRQAAGLIDQVAKNKWKTPDDWGEGYKD